MLWNILDSMKTVQIVLDSGLLRATDAAAKRARVNRSALVRRALKEHLRRLETRELEARDRAGYAKGSQDRKDAERWEQVAAWPEA